MLKKIESIMIESAVKPVGQSRRVKCPKGMWYDCVTIFNSVRNNPREKKLTIVYAGRKGIFGYVLA